MNTFSKIAVALVLGVSVVPAVAQAQGPMKHHPNISVNGRLNNQMHRINKGIASGKLSTAQASKLDSRDAAIAAQTARDRARDHGRLTAAQRRHLQHRLNIASNHIARQKGK